MASKSAKFRVWCFQAAGSPHDGGKERVNEWKCWGRIWVPLFQEWEGGKGKRGDRERKKEEEREWFLFRENFMITEKFCKMRFHCVILMLTKRHHFVSF